MKKIISFRGEKMRFHEWLQKHKSIFAVAEEDDIYSDIHNEFCLDTATEFGHWA